MISKRNENSTGQCLQKTGVRPISVLCWTFAGEAVDKVINRIKNMEPLIYYSLPISLSWCNYWCIYWDYKYQLDCNISRESSHANKATSPVAIEDHPHPHLLRPPASNSTDQINFQLPINLIVWQFPLNWACSSFLPGNKVPSSHEPQLIVVIFMIPPRFSWYINF